MITLPGLLYGGLDRVGVTSLVRSVRDSGVVLCYHNVEAQVEGGDTGAPGAHMPVERFRKQMRWLAAHYEMLPLSGVIDRLVGGRSLRHVASVTFDDAYSGVFEYAWPVLRELGIPATVFVITSAPGRREPFWWDQANVQRADASRRREWLTTLRGDADAILGSLGSGATSETLAPARLPAPWSVIAEAARSGLELGVHSSRHRALPTLGDEELAEEVEGSRAVLARESGSTAAVFAFPYGLWDERVRTRVRQAGYRAALTLDYGLLDRNVDCWALPRINVPATIRGPAFRAWAAGMNLRFLFAR